MTRCCRKKTLGTLFSLFLLFVTQGRAAVGLEESAAANRCSAIFMILTSVQKIEPGLGIYFTQLGRLSSQMVAVYLEDETGKVATNGQLTSKKSAEMDMIGNRYPSNYTKVEQEIKSCIGWAVAVGKVLEKNESQMKKRETAMKVFLSAPKPTSKYAYPFPDFTPIKPLLKAGFEQWVVMGKITPNSIRDALKKSQ